jgi:hypothetical protein
MYFAKSSTCSVELVVSGNPNWFKGTFSPVLLDPVAVNELTVIAGTTKSCPSGQSRCNAVMAKSGSDPMSFAGSVSSLTTPQTVVAKLGNKVGVLHDSTSG